MHMAAGFRLRRPFMQGTRTLLKVMKAIIINGANKRTPAKG